MRSLLIEEASDSKNAERIKTLFESGFTQNEIDYALEIAIAYSRIKTARYLLSIGADISANEYQGVYYAASNNELGGLQFAVENGVDINLKSGMVINTAIQAALNSKETDVLSWLISKGASLELASFKTWKLVKEYGSLEIKNLLVHLT